MKKILILIIILLLGVLCGYALINGISLGDFDILSIKQIEQRNDNTDELIVQADKLANSDYLNAMKTLREQEENVKKAFEILSKTTVLGSVCGRICPHLKQCEGSCVRGIKGEPVNIGKIEAYVFDEALKNEWYKDIEKTKELTGKKIAVVGSGPAGLTCSSFLARSGAEVTLYEKYNELRRNSCTWNTRV